MHFPCRTAYREQMLLPDGVENLDHLAFPINLGIRLNKPTKAMPTSTSSVNSNIMAIRIAAPIASLLAFRVSPSSSDAQWGFRRFGGVRGYFVRDRTNFEVSLC